MKKGNALQRVILFQAQVINTGQMNIKWEVISQSFYNNNDNSNFIVRDNLVLILCYIRMNIFGVINCCFNLILYSVC